MTGVSRIEMHSASEAFTRCWTAARDHIEAQADGNLRSWLKVDLTLPILEHLSFRLGNQLFFIRVVDIEGSAAGPGVIQGVMAIAEGCSGRACLMPMKIGPDGWRPQASGWGLIDASTGAALDPPSLVSDERIEMTDWELHDFAVQVVAQSLRKAGHALMSRQVNPNVDPSLWFVNHGRPEWVLVRSARHPADGPGLPANWPQIAESCAEIGKTGHFAAVVVANADDAFAPGVPATPLWRGQAMVTRFAGLTPLSSEGLA